MTQVSYRANLNAASYPFLSENQGRSVIVRGQDGNYIPNVTSQEDKDKAGIPQMYYCHNVMPVEDGMQSVGYNLLVDYVGLTESGFNETLLLRDNLGNKAYLAKMTDTRNYVYLPVSNTWVATTSIPSSAGAFVTTAFINGITYIYFSGIGCYKYNWSTNTLDTVTLTGLTAANVIGITAAAGYMIAWTKSSVAWSSLIDPTDFTPSLSTGAGGGNVQQVKGNITFCFPNMLGFIIYSEDNAVAALASNNTRYPFNYREIVGSGGLRDNTLIAYDADTADHYVYTTDGMQLVTSKSAQMVFPAVTDFVAGSYFEDFDESSLTFSRTVLTSNMKKKVTVVSSRYLIISYGISSFTHALVYDTSQKRWGKLKIDHVDCFEFATLDPAVVEAPKKAVCFLQANGVIMQVDFSVGSTVSSGILVLGKYQYVRTRTLQLDTVELENIRANNTFALYDVPNLDGKAGVAIAGTLISNSNNTRKYGFRSVAINHSLIFKGGFYVVSLQLDFNVHGRR
jgi:hypothetical protein